MLSWFKKILKMKTLSMGAIMAILTLLILVFFLRSKPGIDKKQVFKYSLLMLLVCGIFTVFIFSNDNSALTNYVSIQAFSIMVGTAHCFLTYIWFKWSSRESFWPEMWFNVFIASLASTVFLLVATFLIRSDELEANSVLLWYSTAFIPFIIPYLVLKAFHFAWVIPLHQYKLWYHPLTDDIPDPLQYDLADHMKVIALELDPKQNAVTRNIKVKAPERMELGHYFMSFVEQYNMRNPEEPISLVDEENIAYGWIFYLKTKWYKKTTVFDADMTFNDNVIRENDVIIAERIKY